MTDSTDPVLAALAALVAECTRPDGEPRMDYMGEEDVLRRAIAIVKAGPRGGFCVGPPGGGNTCLLKK